MRVALLSNVTAEVLANVLREQCEVWSPPGFGAWMTTALNPPAAMKTFDPEIICLALDSSHAEFSEADAERALEALAAAFPRALAVVPDLAALADETEEFYDERMWKLAAMPWSLRALKAIAAELNRLASPSLCDRKKALAIDFDNTLWRGVIGEDGVKGVEPRVEFQRQLLRLKQRGALLVGLSRNNAEEVEPIWNDPRMVLKREDFVAVRVDWREKAENLRAVALGINLGLDAFVFIDDDPAERLRMRALCPAVEVPDFTPTEAEFARLARRLRRRHFPLVSITSEDRKKTELYQAEAARREYASALSFDEYLQGLRLWADIHPIREDEYARVAQLSQKSNQFNVCTNRYSVDELAELAHADGRILLTVRAGDRFGDLGLVSFVGLRISDSEAEIVDWVMSCRAMQRRLEYVVAERVKELLLSRGVVRVRATWRKTAKNEPVREFFESLGFKVVKVNSESKFYEREMP